MLWGTDTLVRAFALGFSNVNFCAKTKFEGLSSTRNERAGLCGCRPFEPAVKESDIEALK